MLHARRARACAPIRARLHTQVNAQALAFPHTNLRLALRGAGCQVTIVSLAYVSVGGLKRGLQKLDVLLPKLHTVTLRLKENKSNIQVLRLQWAL